MPKTIEELAAELAELRQRQSQGHEARQTDRGEQTIANSVPADPYAVTSWGSDGYDFTTPSGQRCRLRNLPLEELAAQGILDRITRLPGLVDDLVQAAEGAPPTKVAESLKPETIELLNEVVNKLVPIVVMKPEVWAIPDPADEDEDARERKAGRIYVDSIDFIDRVAIMNRAVGGLKKLDSFRNQSNATG